MNKKFFYFQSLLLIFIIPIILISSCGEEVEDSSPTLVPTISTISPENGKQGDIITIKGNQFGSDKSNVKVKFDMIDATNIVSVAETKIEVAVPAGLLKPIVDITVHVASISSNKKSFSYVNPKAPFIDSVSPRSGKL